MILFFYIQHDTDEYKFSISICVYNDVKSLCGILRYIANEPCVVVHQTIGAPEIIIRIFPARRVKVNSSFIVHKHTRDQCNY